MVSRVAWGGLYKQGRVFCIGFGSFEGWKYTNTFLLATTLSCTSDLTCIQLTGLYMYHVV